MVLAQLVIHLEECKIGPISLNIFKNKLRWIKDKCWGGSNKNSRSFRIAHGRLGPWVSGSSNTVGTAPQGIIFSQTIWTANGPVIKAATQEAGRFRVFCSASLSVWLLSCGSLSSCCLSLFLMEREGANAWVCGPLYMLNDFSWLPWDFEHLPFSELQERKGHTSLVLWLL